MISFVVLCLLLGAGHILRVRVRLLQRLYLPSCVVGGLLGLLIVQSFAAMNGFGEPIRRINAALSQWSELWSVLPRFLINIVFACLFLGVKLPKFKTLWQSAGLQLAYGQIIAWGQYVVGLGLWLVGLGYLFSHLGLPSMFAGVLEIGFEGGHGTAAGMAETFEHYGWPEGKDFALASATFGVISAITFGMVLINWAVRRGYTEKRREPADIEEDDSIAIIPVDRRPIAGRLSVSSDIVESFSLHIVAVGIAVGLGYIAKQGLIAIENSSAYLTKYKLLSGFPLFPLCMLGGLTVQILEERFDKHRLIDIGLTRRIQNASLDFLVVAAIATIRLEIVLAGLAPLLILVAAGITWNVFCVLFLARRVFRDAWFERAIAEMGQSMGVTATGLLLLRVVDPDYETAAAEAFACKQLMHEPIMGGGLWTAMAIPFIAIYGPGKVFLIAASAVMLWLLIIFVPRIFRSLPG
jgi:ESS family glutamate:Na+ symporter